MLDRIAAMLGGRAAEELVTGEPSSGATNDIEAAVTLARRMVAEFGMSERFGPSSVKPFALGDGVGGGYSDRLASEMDAEVQEILREGNARALAVLRAHRGSLDAVAHARVVVRRREGDRRGGAGRAALEWR